MMTMDAIVTMPPDVVRTRASSTVLVKASSRVNRDLAGIVRDYLQRRPRTVCLICLWSVNSGQKDYEVVL